MPRRCFAVYACQRCGRECGARFGCSGCFALFYCSDKCRRAHASLEHDAGECLRMRQQMQASKVGALLVYPPCMSSGAAAAGSSIILRVPDQSMCVCVCLRVCPINAGGTMRHAPCSHAPCTMQPCRNWERPSLFVHEPPSVHVPREPLGDAPSPSLPSSLPTARAVQALDGYAFLPPSTLPPSWCCRISSCPGSPGGMPSPPTATEQLRHRILATAAKAVKARTQRCAASCGA